MMEVHLDASDIRNGWTIETLTKYREERLAAHPLVAGNVITSFKRPKPAKYLIGAKSFNPHKWR